MAITLQESLRGPFYVALARDAARNVVDGTVEVAVDNSLADEVIREEKDAPRDHG